MHHLTQTIAAIFRQHFSGEPAIYFSPGRINLIGEHIDYNDGFVMPAAIDKGICYAIALTNSNIINMYAADVDEVFSININDVQKNEGWKNYLLSVINEFVLAGIPMKGFDCVFGGDIPQGSGMSSSAAVEGGLAVALNDLLNGGFTKIELAQLCQRAEHNFPGVKCGIMDQFANMMGKIDQVILLDCQDLNYTYLPLKIDGYKIVLLNTNVQHSLAAGEYNLRRKQCEEGLRLMGEGSSVRSFRDITKAEDLLAYKNVMGEEVYMRCLYVVEEIERTKRAATELKENNLVEFGKLMFKTHEGLSNLYNVSCKELDFLVAVAAEDGNVIGARMMGGGFGGCTINIVKDDNVGDFIAKSLAAYQHEFGIAAAAYIVATSDGVQRLA